MKTPVSIIVVALTCFLTFKVNGLVSDDPVLPVTLNVPVWIAGIPDVSPGFLTASLQNILPRFFPAAEGGKPIHDVQLSLNYEVRRTPDSFLQHYEAFILEHASTDDGVHIVFVDEIANFVRGEMEDDSNFRLSFPTFDIFTLPVVILDSKTIVKHKIVSNGEELDQCTMSVLSSVAFIDLSAVTCDITDMISHNAKQIRWATPVVSLPFPFTYLLSKKAKYEGSQQSYSNHLTARVAGLVTSAIQAMTTSNLKWRPAQATEKIYCPIVLLKNGLGIAGHEQLPNIPALESWLQSILLPNQEVVLITTVHYIDEHPQLSVAVASSHMTYAATVAATATIPAHIEKIPYIDSNLLFHELTTVGDRLCDLLLHQTGHGEALRNLMQEEEVKESIGPKVKAGRSDHTAKEKSWRSAAVVPVFVIGDVHIHHERQLNIDTIDDISKNGEHFPAAIVDIPVQPLFNKDSPIAVDSDSSSVLVLHSTHHKVSTFSPHTKTWKQVVLSDLDSLIAEGLTRALTGFNAPHAQLEKADVVDLTFTHGTHPFGPFGQLPYEPAQYHSIFSTSIQRGTLIARAHRVMQRAISISHRAAALDNEISDGFRYLHSLHGSSRQVRTPLVLLHSLSSCFLKRLSAFDTLALCGVVAT
jgi:hypothetical protein